MKEDKNFDEELNSIHCDIDAIFKFFVEKKLEEKKINEYRNLPLNEKLRVFKKPPLSERFINKNIVLLGDSIIDNKSYVSENQNSVLEHLNKLSIHRDKKYRYEDFRYQQLAVDGHTTQDLLKKQLNNDSLKNATNIVLSIGGNDLLQNLQILFENNSRILNDSFVGIQQFIFSPLQDRFETIVEKLSSHRANLLLCTVYEGDLGRSDEYRDVLDSSKIMVSSFNDMVYKTANKYNADVLELRHVFTSPEDYANPIEPSHIGGEKLAQSIVQWIRST